MTPGATTVLHVANRLGGSGGAERSLAVMLPELEARGVHNIVLPLEPRVWHDRQRLLDAGITVLTAPRPRLAAQIRALRGAVREHRPDVVHSCLWSSDLVARLALLRGTPVVSSIVSSPYSAEARAHVPSPWRLDMYRRVDGLLARHLTTRLHAVTEATAREAERALGVPAEQMLVVPRGRDPETLRPPEAAQVASVRDALGVRPGQLLVSNVARHEFGKGPIDLLRAFAAARISEPGLVLAQMGRTGSATAEMHDLVAALGLEEHVRLLGVRDDVLDVVGASEAFVSTSYSEGFAGAVVEAMALGRPVVAYAAASVVEVLGGTGVVVPIPDHDGLARALVDLLRDESEARRLGDAARSRFLARYSLGAVADETVAMYQVLAEQGKGTRLTRGRSR